MSMVSSVMTWGAACRISLPAVSGLDDHCGIFSQDKTHDRQTQIDLATIYRRVGASSWSSKRHAKQRSTCRTNEYHGGAGESGASKSETQLLLGNHRSRPSDYYFKERSFEKAASRYEQPFRSSISWQHRIPNLC